jgi:hypothetical protein
MDPIEIGTSSYPTDTPSQLSVECSAELLGQIAAQCPEARSGPEALRILAAEAARERAQQVTPKTIECAHREAVADIRQDIAEMRALMQSLADR